MACTINYQASQGIWAICALSLFLTAQFKYGIIDWAAWDVINNISIEAWTLPRHQDTKTLLSEICESRSSPSEQNESTHLSSARIKLAEWDPTHDLSDDDQVIKMRPYKLEEWYNTPDLSYDQASRMGSQYMTLAIIKLEQWDPSHDLGDDQANISHARCDHGWCNLI